MAPTQKDDAPPAGMSYLNATQGNPIGNLFATGTTTPNQQPNRRSTRVASATSAMAPSANGSTADEVTVATSNSSRKGKQTTGGRGGGRGQSQGGGRGRGGREARGGGREARGGGRGARGGGRGARGGGRAARGGGRGEEEGSTKKSRRLTPQQKESRANHRQAQALIKKMKKTKEEVEEMKARYDELQGIIDNNRNRMNAEGETIVPPAQTQAKATQHVGKKKKKTVVDEQKLAPADRVQYQSPKKNKEGSNKRTARSAPQTSPGRGTSYEAVSAVDTTVGTNENEDSGMDGRNLFKYTQEKGGETATSGNSYMGDNNAFGVLEDQYSDDDELGYGGGNEKVDNDEMNEGENSVCRSSRSPAAGNHKTTGLTVDDFVFEGEIFEGEDEDEDYEEDEEDTEDGEDDLDDEDYDGEYSDDLEEEDLDGEVEEMYNEYEEEDAMDTAPYIPANPPERVSLANLMAQDNARAQTTASSTTSQSLFGSAPKPPQDFFGEPKVQFQFGQHKTPSAQGPIPAVTPASGLQASSYAGVPHAPIPVNEVPLPPAPTNVFDDVEREPGTGGGPHYIMMGFEKKFGVPMRDQVVGAVGYTADTLIGSAPDLKLHSMTEGIILPPVTGSTPDKNCPQTYAGCKHYFFINNRFSLIPLKKEPKKKKRQTQQEQGFDEERKYDGPNMVWGVLMVSSAYNVKDLVEALNIDLDGTGVALRWKDVQRRETNTSIGIVGVPRGFCVEGMNAAVLYALKKIEKTLCTGSKRSMDLYDVPLPPLRGYWRQARNFSQSSGASKKYSLNRLIEYRKNGCQILHFESDPSDFGRMGELWNLFYTTGACARVCGLKSKVIVFGQGNQTPHVINKLQRLKSFQCQYSSKIEFVRHKGIVNVAKEVEIVMEDPTVRPPRKFTSLAQEYADLRCPTTQEVVAHAIVPCLRGLDAGSADVTFLSKNEEAESILRKIEKDPAAWWWHVWGSVKGYDVNTRRTLMESFDIDAAMLAAHSTFDVTTFVVTSEFAAEDDFLDNMEAEFAITDEDLVGENNGAVKIDIPANAQEELVETLRDHDGEDIDDDKTGASRRPGFAGSVGNKSLRSQHTAKYAADAKERALELAREKNKSATQARELAEERKKREASEKQHAELLKRLQAMETLVAKGNGPSTGAPPEDPEAHLPFGEGRGDA